MPGLVLLLPTMATFVAGGEPLAIVVAHAGAATAAASAFRSTFQGKEEVWDRSPQNQLVVHWVLFAPSVVLLPAMATALSVDAICHGGWRWPTLSMAATNPTSAAVLGMASLPLAVASAAVFWVLATMLEAAAASTGGAAAVGTPYQDTIRRASKNGGAFVAAASSSLNMQPSLSLWRQVCCQLGCCLACVSIACGCGAALLVEGAPLHNVLHDALSIAFFATMVMAEVFMSAGSGLSAALGQIRIFVAGMLLVCSLVQLALFLLVNQFIPNTYDIPHAVYALSEYGSLCLLLAWPITWVHEVSGAPLSSESSRRCP